MRAEVCGVLEGPRGPGALRGRAGRNWGDGIYQPLCKYFSILPTSIASTVCNTGYQPWQNESPPWGAEGTPEPKVLLRNPSEYLCVIKVP